MTRSMVSLTLITAALGLAALLVLLALPSCNKSRSTGQGDAQTASSLPPVSRPGPGDSIGSGSSGGASQGSAPGGTSAVPPAPGPEAGDLAKLEVEGRNAYTAGNCGMCHGANREGGKLGPPLTNLCANWDKDKLPRYFGDPAGYAAADSRLSAMSKKYAMPMPRPRLSDEQLAALAQWLLK